MSDGFYHGKDGHYSVRYTAEELRMRSLETDADDIYAEDAARLYRKSVRLNVCKSKPVNHAS